MFSLVPLVAFAVVLVAPSAVDAHGYVHSLEVGGKNYTGWLPFTDPYESPVPTRIVRKLPDDGPVLDVTSPDLACNKGGETGTGAVATAAAGSQVVFDWATWPSDHQGPVSTYMASCNGDCTKFDTSDAKWFKVDAGGYSNSTWAATLLIENGFKWTSTIPSELAAGEYLMRNEIVALHSVGQPQFYPSCAQVKVTGGGGKTPSGSELVSIPGLYNDVQWPDIWSDSFKSFTIPGPAPAFSGSSGENTDPSTPSSTASATHTSSTHASSSVSAAAAHSASSTHVSTTVPSTTADSQATSSVATSSAAASTGKCSSKRRRGMVKRHVSHLAKRHH